MEQLTVLAGADLIDWAGVEIDKNGARDIFAAAGLAEEGLKRTSLNVIVSLWLRATICLQTVFEQVACDILVLS
jgi:hypothetical protein